MDKQIIEEIINNIINNEIVDTKCGRGQHGSKNPREETLKENPAWIQGQDPTITHFTDDNGEDMISYKYENVGENEDTTAEILFEDSDFDDYAFKKLILTDKNGDTQELEYMGKPFSLEHSRNANEFFQQHKELILDKYGEEGWDFFIEYSSRFASAYGWDLNAYLRGLRDKGDVDDYLMDNYNCFLDMEKNLNLSMGETYVTLRVFDKLHDNDDSDKRIVSDKAHTSATVGAEMSDLDVFAYTSEIGACYRCLTVVPSGIYVPGAYFGTAMQESDSKDNWEVETNFAPDNKFKRLFVDEENKIIVQEAIGI